MENNPQVDETDSTAAPVDATSQQISPTDDTQNEPAQHVRDLAVLLFEVTQPMHDLNEDSRSALELAALHHDLPIPSTKKKPYKAAIELLQSRLPDGLPAETTGLAGAIIVVCQGKLKRKDIAKLGLSPQQQREVLTMAAIIRIAIGLDHSGSHQITIRQLETARDGMWIVVDGPQAIADAEAAQHNAGLWEKIIYSLAYGLDCLGILIRDLTAKSVLELHD